MTRNSTRWRLHYAALLVLSLGLGVLFVREPGFGDDFGYWSLAFNLHEIGPRAWRVHNFHDLRWPVWGVNWLWQSCFGLGLPSFYCTPILYLCAAAALAFAVGRLVMGSASGAWICAIALLFDPLLDSVINRPMPDLSETVFSGCAVLAWWVMMRAEKRRRAVFFGIVSGLGVGLAFSNRITGIFIVPVLIVATVSLFPTRWKWLLVPAAAAAIYFFLECAVYYHVCGDWLHSIHANLGGRGAKDTDPISIINLPFRYLNGFYRGNRIAPIYALLTLLGLYAAWRKWGAAGRLVVLWFGVLYLEYSCAVQSIHPVRPLLGAIFRYLGALSLPVSVLAGIGLVDVWPRIVRVMPRMKGPSEKMRQHPFLAGCVVVAALALCSSRPFFDLGYVTELRRYMEELPPGTKIFTHQAMHDAAHLVDAHAARALVWRAPKTIFNQTDALEKEAAACDEFWYERKLLWMRQRKTVQQHQPDTQPPLGSYLATPERDWRLNRVICRNVEPEIVLYRRRESGSPPPQIFTWDSVEFRELIRTLPLTWSSHEHKRQLLLKWNVAPQLRGNLVRLEFDAASPSVEPLAVELEFTAGSQHRAEYLLKPILYAAGGKEFFPVAIPADADECVIELKFAGKAKRVELTGFRAVLDGRERER